MENAGKKRKEKQTQVLFSNYYSNEIFEEMKRRLFEDENGGNWETENEITDGEVFEKIWSQNEMDLEDFRLELSHFLEGKTLVITGTVGLWNGTYAAGKVARSLNDLFSLLRDCDDFKFTDCGGRFFITGTHHDGTNNFEVRILNENGLKKLSQLEDNDETRGKICRTLFNSNFYSGIPHFAKKVYGTKE